MNIAIVSNQAFALINFRSSFITEIVGRGHRVFGLAPDFDVETERALRSLGAEPVSISLSRTGLNPVRDLADFVTLWRALSDLNVDAAFAFGIKPVIYGTLAALFARVPHRFALIAGLGYAFGENSRNGLKNSALHFIARGMYRVALRHAEKVFMQNPDDAEDFIRMGIVGRDKIVPVNGTGVDLDAWPVLPRISQHMTFMLVARLLAEKGILEFIAAARQIKADAPETRFVILGGLDTNPNGISRGQMEAWVAEGVVEWPGHVPVRPWLAQASVFVLPSYYREGVPRSIQEAMASGRPIITTDRPGCRETVIEGVNGFLVPPRDPDALVEAMRKFLSDPKLVPDMGMESRKYAERKFDIHVVNSTMAGAMGL